MEKRHLNSSPLQFLSLPFSVFRIFRGKKSDIKNLIAPPRRNDDSLNVPGTPAKSKISHLVPLLLSWFAHNARDLPWRRAHDPYAIWVSEIMLQQTQVNTVLGYWERWLTALPSITDLAQAKSETIHKLWEGLGYYTRVRNLQAAAREILANHGGKFPHEYDAILELPGIGRYTAGAIASIAFNEPRAILDGNVIRVLTRVFGIAENPRDKAVNTRLWTLAQALVDSAAKSPQSTARLACSALNQSLMELGALICTPRQPKCGECPINRHCAARRTGRTESIPNLGKRAPATSRHFAAFIIERRGRFLVRQRPAGVVNAHLWEFPNIEVDGNNFDPLKVAKTALGFPPVHLVKLHQLKHTITRYRMTLDAYTGTDADPKTARTAGRWVTPAKLRALPFSSAHRQIVARLNSSKAPGVT